MLYYLELCEYGVDSALVVQISRFNTCLDAVTFKSKLPTDGYIVQLSVAMKASLLLLRCTTLLAIASPSNFLATFTISHEVMLDTVLSRS
jgi:hypothetical protein